MKTKNIILVLFAVALLFMVSCEKAKTFLPKMEAVIGGEQWSAITRKTNLSTNGYFTIIGTSKSGEILEITIRGDQEKIYNLNPLSGELECNAVYKEAISMSTDDIYNSYSGTVNLYTVNNSDKRISGTFSFKMTRTSSIDTLSVKSGEFSSLSYTIKD